jgi:hypothetical protein
MSSFQQRKEKLYKALLPYKMAFQSNITNAMYDFKFENTNINIILESFIESIFYTFLTKLESEFKLSRQDIWNHFRFYLKGGKALNKLIRKICKEDKYNLIVEDTKEIIKNINKDKCFVNNQLFPSSNTDYDFSFLVKDKKYFPGVDSQNRIDNLIKVTLTSVSNILNKEEQFKRFSNALLKKLNTYKFLSILINALQTTIKDLKNASDQTSDQDIKYYFLLKIRQIDNFINTVRYQTQNKEDTFVTSSVTVSSANIPININNLQIFYLYRLKLSFALRFPHKTLSKDIRDFLNGQHEITALPFDNIFAELIDISIPVGNDDTLKKLWKYSNLEYMLRPVYYIDQIEKPRKKFFKYPVVSLKSQIKDVVQIFNMESGTKISKRCNRLIEFLNMMCHSETIPEEFIIRLSGNLLEEIQKSPEGSCSQMEAIIRKLSNDNVINNTIIVTKTQLKRLFPDFCLNQFNVDFRNKEDLITQILTLSSKLEDDIDISREQLSKISYNSLLKIVSSEKKDFYKYLTNIENFDILERIIPIEII